MSDVPLPRTPEEVEAWVAKTTAEARLIQLQGDRAIAEARISEHMATGATIAADREMRKHVEECASDESHRLLRYHGALEPRTVLYVTAKVDEWRRIDALSPETFNRPYSLHLTSPGGSIVDGLALYDYLKKVDKEHPLTTVAIGTCASMATVVLQAGSTRVSYASTSWLIHRASWGAYGREDAIEDVQDHVKLVQERIFEILGNRADISIKALKAKSSRKDWWFLGAEALTMGLVDELW
jgi:ATP-dependent protease ClpP protease subunit